MSDLTSEVYADMAQRLLSADKQIAELQAEVERLKRSANIGVGASIEVAAVNASLENEISTLRESLTEVNRLLSLHIAEVARLQSALEELQK